MLLTQLNEVNKSPAIKNPREPGQASTKKSRPNIKGPKITVFINYEINK